MLKSKCSRLLIGFSFMTFQVIEVADYVKNIRRSIPDAILIAGGPHATGDPLGTLLNLGFDIVVYGEGEDTLVDLVDSVANGGEPYVCGTAFIESGKMIVRKRHSYVDLDSYPPFPYWRKRFNPIEIMRGCYSSCYFCQVTYAFGLPRYRSVENIVMYSKIALHSGGLRDLRFIAPNSLGYGGRDGIKPSSSVIDLLHRLRSLANDYGGRIFFGTFPSEVRPDSVEENIVKELRRYVDNKRIIVGAQSGSNRVLRIIHRGHTVEDVVNAVEILVKNGFGVDIDLIFGFPFETDDDIQETLKFVEKLRVYDVRFHLHYFIPLPGTPYSGYTPRPLDEGLRNRLFKLIGFGKAYGDWLKQEVFSKSIVELFKKGIVYDIYSNYRNAKILKC